MGNVEHFKNITDYDWSPERGYPDTKSARKYSPAPVPAAGVNNGLTVILNQDIKEYYCSAANGPGFIVAVHSPVELPIVKSRGILLESGMETLLRINVNKLEAEDISDISPTYRQCLFEREQKLKVFKTYTRGNCENECEADRFWYSCHCIPFHFLPIGGNETICGLNHSKCIEDMNIYSTNVNLDMDCESNCTEGCIDLNYWSDSFHSRLRKKGNYTISSTILSNMTNEFVNDNIARVTIFFRHSTFRSDKKTPYIGLTEFLCKFSFNNISLLSFIPHNKMYHKKVSRKRMTKLYVKSSLPEL